MASKIVFSCLMEHNLGIIQLKRNHKSLSNSEGFRNNLFLFVFRTFSNFSETLDVKPAGNLF